MLRRSGPRPRRLSQTRVAAADPAGDLRDLTPMPARTIALHEPLDLTRTVGIHLRGNGDPTMRLAPGHLVRATRTGDGPATLEIIQRGDRLHAEAWGAGADRALDGVPAFVGLLDDRSAF